MSSELDQQPDPSAPTEGPNFTTDEETPSLAVQPPALPPLLPTDNILHSCKCLKSKCLKLYCDCFRHNTLCGSDCSCQSCSNTMEHNGPGGARALAMLGVLRSRPGAFDGGVPIELGINEESVVAAYQELKRSEEEKVKGEDAIKMRGRSKRVEELEVAPTVRERKKVKVKESKWSLPPLEPIPVPNYTIEQVLGEYSGHVYDPPPFSLDEFPDLTIDTSQDYSSLVNAFKEPLFKDPSPSLAIAYDHRDAAAAERSMLHSKKQEIISRLDAIRRQFAETKAELLNLNNHLKNNSQKVGGWTHKVFELELAERPCGFNEKLEMLNAFVERYGVHPSHKKMNLEELEAAKRAESDKTRTVENKSDEEKGTASAAVEEGNAETDAGNVADDEMKPTEETADEAAANLDASKGGDSEPMQAPDDTPQEANQESTEANSSPTDEPAEKEEQELPDAEMHPVDQPTNEGEQPVEETEQTNKENESEQQLQQKQPHFTDDEVKSLATFISSMKLKIKKNKSILKTQPHRIRALQNCGVRLFENENAARFDVMFERLLAYKKEMGTFRLPSADLCKDSGDEDLIALHNWVFSQVGSFRYQLKTKKISDVKKFLDIGFSFEKWYASAVHVFERDIPAFDKFARQYVESGGVVPPEYEEMLQGEGKYGGRKRKSLHGPKVKRYPNEPDRRLKKNRIAMKENEERKAAAKRAEEAAAPIGEPSSGGENETTDENAADVVAQIGL